jgi:hypothetical protein
LAETNPAIQAWEVFLRISIVIFAGYFFAIEII